jgi:hypothetical protein
MAKCFCGCGRKVSFAWRSWNTTGQRMSDGLRDLDELFALPELAELRDPHEAFLAEGERIRVEVKLILHKEMPPSEFDLEARRAWLPAAWNLQGLLKTTLFGIGEGDSARDAYAAANLGRLIDPWVNRTGLTAEEAGQELHRRMEAGEPMPWEEQT